MELSAANRDYLQLIRQRLSHESVKAYATMPIGIMGSGSLAMLDCIEVQGDSATRNEKKRIHVCAASFHHAKTP